MPTDGLKPSERTTFRDLERFCRRFGLSRPVRAVGGPLRGWYLKHPERVRLVKGWRR